MKVSMIDPAIDAARDAFLAAVPEEIAPETPDVPVESPEPTVEVETPAPPAEAPNEARAYRKLLDGERKLTEGRKALEAERTELAQLKALKDKVTADPVAFLKANGLTEAQLIEALQEAQARDMGKLAPPEVRAQLAAKSAERAAREVEERVEAKLRADATARQQADAQNFVAQYQKGIDTFVSTELTAYPELARVAAAGKPVAQAIWQTATEMAAGRDPNGAAPTYAEVAAQLNAQLAELASVIAPSRPPIAAVTTVDPTAPTPGKPVLRNSTTQAQPSAAPETTPKSYAELVEAVRLKAYAAHGLKG